jgi:NADPH-dependent curcumin reductase CurA
MPLNVNMSYTLAFAHVLVKSLSRTELPLRGVAMTVVPSTSYEVKLTVRPVGLPKPDNFDVVKVPMPAPKADEVLIRNRYFRISASLRMMISEGAECVEGVPFPALRPGDTLFGETVGEVVSAPTNSGLSAGDQVLHNLGWREFAAVPVCDCNLLGDTLPDKAAHLSQGSTAYAALTRGVQIRPGDTVFISSAAGAIGSMAGQIARLLGAGRVVGSTSSQEKARRLISELRYDGVVVRGEKPLAAQLAEVAPDGVDVYLDNVGGTQLQAAVKAARSGARFVVVGALSGQLAAQGTGRTAPVQLDSFDILLKKITMRGYSADDDPEVRSEWTARFADWLRSGDICFPHVTIDGLDAAPGALIDVAEGRHFGVVLIKL